MPLYEYTCGTCLNRFEKLRSFSQMDDPTPCPDCGSESRRQLSVFMSFSTDANGQTTPVAGGRRRVLWRRRGRLRVLYDRVGLHGLCDPSGAGACLAH